MERTKSRWTIVVFALLLLGGMVAHLLLPDQALSRAERRKLQQFPDITWESLSSAEFSQEVEDYLLDQFPLRDGFRTLKAIWSYYILGQKDNNGVYIAEGSASKLDSQLDEKQLKLFTDKMNALYQQYFPDAQVYCAIVPDKNYYLAPSHGYPTLDYETLFTTVEEALPWATHIDLTGSLTAADYYATDSHWRQEKLDRVVAALAQAMDLQLPDWSSYEAVHLPGFQGVYYGQAALPLPAEDLVYLKNETTEGCTVSGPEDPSPTVYDPAKFENLDGYDVFLSGAQAVLTIENPNAATDRSLVIFRDSYGSSLAPLLLDGYATVTLVDVRYVNSQYLGQFVDFSQVDDVLLLYSTTVVNAAGILR